MRVLLATMCGLGFGSTAIAQCAPVEPVDGSLRVELTPIVSTSLGDIVVAPTSLAFPKDGSGRFFWCERLGTIRVFDGSSVLPTPMLDLFNEILNIGSRGVLGLELHPGFSDQNSIGYRRLYTWHTVLGTGVTPDYALPNKVHQVLLTEWQVSAANPNVIDVNTRRELLRMDHADSSHSGGGLVFDNDGYLYFTMGTPQSATLNGQDNTHPDGAICRIDPNDPALTPGSSDPISKNGKYRIPATNPFVGSQTNAPEVYSWGYRHPWSISFDAQTGAFFAADVGQDAYEELDFVTNGSNGGWPYREAYCPWTVPLPNPAPVLTEPVAAYDQVKYGRSIIAGEIYRGSAMPEAQGLYIFGDFSNSPSGFFNEPGTLFYADALDQNGQPKGTNLQIRRVLVGKDGKQYDMNAMTMTAAPDGEIYLSGVVSFTNGTEAAILRIDPLSCYADCDDGGSLDFFDFLCFQNYFATGDLLADCDFDGQLTFFDFLCFQNAFVQATNCP